MQIKLLLLDFDGTLADTRRANTLAYVDALAEEGFELSEELYLQKYFGLRCTEFLRDIGYTREEDIERIRHRKIELYPNHFDTVRLNRPLWDFVQAFRAQGGKAWVVSTGHRDNVTNAMRYLGIEDGFDGILTSEAVEHSKPSPDCFLKAMEAEGVTPAETLIFEDSEVGIEAARRSGAGYFVVRL
ncbi:MAG: HAD family phosphatase [Alistipes sp.]|nr:HAD family phosphatase [Alistipes sp.]MBQ3247824.1 HAD family phosphatase [Alistipes sp.]